MPANVSDAEASTSGVDGRGEGNAPSSLAGFSSFIGKVLDQLSLSAWLPAAMLVGNLALLLQLNQDKDFSIERAVQSLAAKPLGTVIILVFSLVLTTLVTQAFAFEIIRFLEGYLNTTNRVVRLWIALRIKRHDSKRDRLKRELGDAILAAFTAARARMNTDWDRKLLDVLDDEFNGRAPKKKVKAKIRTAAHELPWRRFAPPSALHRIDTVETRLRSYPQKHRTLPTQLGNVLRVAEDTVKLIGGENLESFVIRNYDILPTALRREHDDYRTRLDMYCSLIPVFAALLIASVPALSGMTPAWGVAVVGGSYAAMIAVSYRAAIASARGYGNALIEIGRFVNEYRRKPEGREPVSASSSAPASASSPPRASGTLE